MQLTNKPSSIVDAEELKRKHTVVLEQARPLDLNSEAHAAKEPDSLHRLPRARGISPRAARLYKQASKGAHRKQTAWHQLISAE
jgi:hypothetical protein